MIEEAIYTIATAHAGLTALIGTRLYPIVEENRHELPRVVFEKDSVEFVSGIEVDSGWMFSRFTFTAVAATPDGVKELVEQLRSAFQRYHGTVGAHVIDDVKGGGGGDFYDHDLGVYGEEVTFEFFHT